MRELYPEELERAKRAKPLPLDASWSTGDGYFDARIHASLMQRDALLESLQELVDRRERAIREGGGRPDVADGRWGRARAALALAKGERP